MFDKEAAALEADTTISSEGKKRRKITEPIKHSHTWALSLEPTKRRPLGGTRVWCRYPLRLSAEARKMKRQKETQSGRWAEAESTVIAHLSPLCHSSLIVPNDTWARKPDTGAIDFS